MPLLKQLKWLWVVLLFLPLIFTTKIQFSCYPLITNGELPQVCYQEPNISNVVIDSHTHGNVLYKIGTTTKEESILRKLFSNLDIPRVDYEPQRVQIAILGNTSTPPDLSETIFNNLISDKVPLSENLLRILALNPNTSESILQSLVSTNNEYINSLISQRSQLSVETIALLYNFAINYDSIYEYDIFSGIASQQNASSEILEKLLEKAKIIEKLGKGDECSIYQGFSKNPVLKQTLPNKAEKIINRDKECKKKPLKCQPQLKRNITWGLIAGGAVIATVLVIGSGGLLAPIAIGASALTAGATFAAGEFLSRCP